MKLYISYSRDDKDWVLAMSRTLRERATHDVWLDQQNDSPEGWWETILNHIEGCECFLYVMTPRSIDSIYCQAELGYAVALNKAILPLMLKPSDQPEGLRSRRVQFYQVGSGDSMRDVQFIIERGLSEILVGQAQGRYAPQAAPRPPEPLPRSDRPAQLTEVYLIAEEAVMVGNPALAEKLFARVADLPAGPDIGTWNRAAIDRLVEIRHDRERQEDYQNIVRMAADPNSQKGARAAARAFIVKYGSGFDPDGILLSLLGQDHRNSDTIASAASIRGEAADTAILPTTPDGRYLVGIIKKRFISAVCRISIEIYPERSFQSILLVGDFNNWSETATPMTRHPHSGDDYFSATLELDVSHRYRFRLLADNEWFDLKNADAHSAGTLPNGSIQPYSILSTYPPDEQAEAPAQAGRAPRKSGPLEVPVVAALWFSSGPQDLLNRRIPIEVPLITLGRDTHNDIVVGHPEVSRHHLRITRDGDDYYLEDLGSTNGTFVNGERVLRTRLLHDGDGIVLGEQVGLTFVIEG